MTETLTRTVENLEHLSHRPALRDDWMSEWVTDKGYHSNQRLRDLGELGIRTDISEPDPGRRRWTNKPAEKEAVYANRGRGVTLERTFAHGLNTGGMRRVFLHGRANVLKRCVMHYAALNLRFLLRGKFGHPIAETPPAIGDLPPADSEAQREKSGLFHATVDYRHEEGMRAG